MMKHLEDPEDSPKKKSSRSSKVPAERRAVPPVVSVEDRVAPCLRHVVDEVAQRTHVTLGGRQVEGSAAVVV